MIKLENTEVLGWESVIRGMRNPMNSWSKSDSSFDVNGEWHDICGNSGRITSDTYLDIGYNDLSLMKKLRSAGTDHRKFMRMIAVYVDVVAPLYWWKEFDTYKVGTVANSCSTMHKIHSKEFTLDDFSIDNFNADYGTVSLSVSDLFENVIADCEMLRKKYVETDDKKYWKALIQLLPSSYNQRRTLMLNYEVLANIYKSRKNHKLDEWHTFCDWIETLPYAKELIIGEE